MGFISRASASSGAGNGRRSQTRFANPVAFALLLLNLPSILPAQSVNITEFSSPTAGAVPYFIAAGPDGSLWFTEYGSSSVARITTAGSITEYATPTSSSTPTGIAAGPDGALWFTERARKKIGRITVAGVFTEYPLPASAGPPTAIATGPDGAMWFIDTGDPEGANTGPKIGRITIAGAITEFPIPSAGGSSWGIAAGSDGAMWFAGSSNKIGRITTAGAVTEFELPPGSYPVGIAKGSDGAMWFTEFSNRIGRITTAGAVTEFNLAAANNAPNAITLGADGAMWFTDSATNQIGRITTAGVISEYPVPTAGSSPTGIVLGPDGALWFTEFTANRIGRAAVVTQGTGNVTFVTSPAGQTVTVDGVAYPTPKSFTWPAGENHQVSVVSPQAGGTGTRYAFASWSDGGAQAHTLAAPAAATTYTATFTTQYLLTTVVVPSGSGTVSANPASPDGYFNSGVSVQLTAIPAAPATFSNWSGDLSGTANPQSLAMNAPHRVQANFSGASTSFTFSEFPTANVSGPTYITAGPDGSLWFTEAYASRIGHISTSGVITELPLPASTTAGAIATGPDGLLWFAEGNKIGRLTIGGVLTEFSLSSGTSAYGIASGTDGALWFTESSNSIGRITTNGAITEFPIPTPGSTPTAIVTGPDGSLWFTEPGSNKIGRITTTGVIAEFAIPTANSSPAGIAAGPDGAVWFAEANVDKIGRITTSGAITEFTVPSAGSRPSFLTGGPDGAVWFTEFNGNKIGRITTAGVVSEVNINTAGSGPAGIAAGPDGGLWFGEQFANKVGRAIPSPNVACAWSLPQASQTFAAAGGSGSALVRAPLSGCAFTAVSNLSWVTVTSGSTGAGNGTVAYTVAANPSAGPRSGTLTIAGLSYTVIQAGTAGAPLCTGAVPSPASVALEGRTETLGDYVLTCTGLSGAMTADVLLTLNTTVTNALSTGTGNATDAFLTVNGNNPQNGLVEGANSLRFPAVSIAPGGNGIATIRITRVRADASLLLTQKNVSTPGNPQPAAITGLASIGSLTPVVIANPVQIMASASESVVFTRSASPPPTGNQYFIPLQFKEIQLTSFQAGITRVRVSLTNVPGTVQVFAPVYPTEGASRAQLYSADASGAGGAPVAGTPTAGGTYQGLTVTGGTTTATWLVLAADAAQLESLTFQLLVGNATTTDLAQIQIQDSLAPVSDLSVASATALVPRFRDFSAQPKLANLRVTTSASIPNSAGTAAPKAVFVIQVVNDTADAAQTATNVVLRDYLPPGLTFANCTAAGSVTCSNSGNQVQANVGALAPGQSASVTVTAQADPSLVDGTVLENPVGATSDQVNLDLLAESASSSVIVLSGGLQVLPGTPGSGSGNSQTFTFQFTHPNGYQNLDVVNVLINSVLDGRNACYLAYQVPTKTLYLVDDAGHTAGPFAGSVVLGSALVIQNSQCAVTLVSADGSGTLLTLKLNITFKTAFGGNRIIYTAARDAVGGNTDWQVTQVWQVPFTPGAIAVGGVAPPRGAAPAGTSQPFTFSFTDTKGTADLGVLNVLINKSVDGRQACYLAYVSSSSTLILVNDSGDAAGPYAGTMQLNGGAASIQNSQCLVTAAGSTVTAANNTLTLTLNITFKSAFAGNRIFYLAARDSNDANNTGWQPVATWTVQ